MSPELAHHPFIKKIWILENSSSMYKRNTGMLVGDGRFELALVTGNGYMTYRGDRIDTFRKGVYLGGQMDRPLDVVVLPNTHITFIKLEPWAVGVLSGFNFRDSLNHTVPFEAINTKLYNKLMAYHPIVDLDKILGLLSQELDNTSKANREWELIKHCCTLFDHEYTNFKSAKHKLLSTFSISSRTLEKKFTKSVGLTPQQYSIGMRFRKFTEELKYAENNITLTDLAYKHGYYDQAHLNQNFKQYWGFSPKKLSCNKTFITNAKEPFRYYTI